MSQSVRYLLRWPSVRMAGALFSVSLLSILAALMFWVPVNERFENNIAAISELKSAISRNASNAQLLSSYQEARKETELFQSGLLKEGENSSAMASISGLADTCGVEIISESLARGNREEGFDIYLYDLAIHGGYKNLRVFLAGLGDIPVRFNVRELEIRKTGPGIEARLRLEAYQASKSSSASL